MKLMYYFLLREDSSFYASWYYHHYLVVTHCSLPLLLLLWIIVLYGWCCKCRHLIPHRNHLNNRAFLMINTRWYQLVLVRCNSNIVNYCLIVWIFICFCVLHVYVSIFYSHNIYLQNQRAEVITPTTNKRQQTEKATWYSGIRICRSLSVKIVTFRSWTFGTKLDFRDREVGLFLWSYLDFLAIPKIQLRDIPTTKVQLRSSKLMFLPASFRTDFVRLLRRISW